MGSNANSFGEYMCVCTCACVHTYTDLGEKKTIEYNENWIFSELEFFSWYEIVNNMEN